MPRMGAEPVSEPPDEGEVDMFGAFITFVVGTHVALAASAGGPPKVDIEATCRTSERELTKIFGSGTGLTYEGCMRQQKEAFELIQKDWATFPADARSHCVQPKVYMPSYVEWLSCLESDRHLREVRKREAESANGKATPANSKAAPAR
jgi:hypothetical protein